MPPPRRFARGEREIGQLVVVVELLTLVNEQVVEKQEVVRYRKQNTNHNITN